MILTSWEYTLCKRLCSIQNSEELDLPEKDDADCRVPPSDSERVVDAEVIRALILGTRLQRPNRSEELCFPISAPIRIKEAVIKGDLDLRELCGRDGHCLPPLLLEYCRFTGRIRLDHSHLTRLSLKGSRFKTLEATSCQIDDALDLEGVASSSYEDDADNPLHRLELLGSAPSPDATPASRDKAEPTADPSRPEIKGHRLGPCWVDLTSARIDGDIQAKNAKLCGRDPDDPSNATREKLYALRLRSAEVGGVILLQPGFVAVGGISFYDARIRGSVWALGARIRALAQQAAIEGQSVEIGQHLQLCATGWESGEPVRFQSIGRIHLHGARIGGELRLGGAMLHRLPIRTPKLAEGDQRPALAIWSAKIGALTLAEERGHSTELHGSLGADGSRIEQDLEIKGTEFLSRERSLQRAKTSGLFTGENPTWPEAAALQLPDASIGGNLTIGEASQSGKIADSARSVEIDDGIVAPRLKVESNVTIVNTSIRCPSQSPPIALDAPSIRVGGNVMLACDVLGDIALPHARIDGKFQLGQRHQDQNPEPLPLRLLWKDKESRGKFDLSEGEIRQSLEVGWLEVGSDAEARSPIQHVRSTPLEFYPGWLLAEAHIRRTSEDGSSRHGIVSFLVPDDTRQRKPILLDGTEAAIRNFNHAEESSATGRSAPGSPLKIDDERKAAGYLKFFCAFVWSDDVAPSLIETMADLPDGASARVKEIDITLPPASRRDGSDFIIEPAIVLRDGRLWTAAFRIAPTGRIAWTITTPLTDLSDLPSCSYAGPIRLLPQHDDEADLAGVENGKADTLRGNGFTYRSLRRRSGKGHRGLALVANAWKEVNGKGGQIQINLTGLSVGSLDDNHGKGWWPEIARKKKYRNYFQTIFEWKPLSLWRSFILSETKPPIALKMDGMTYKRTKGNFNGPHDQSKNDRIRNLNETTGSSIETDDHGYPLFWRQRWLMLQYSDRIDTAKLAESATNSKFGSRILSLDDYNPQPFEELSKAFLSQGDLSFAREIIIFQTDVDQWLKLRTRLIRANTNMGIQNKKINKKKSNHKSRFPRNYLFIAKTGSRYIRLYSSFVKSEIIAYLIAIIFWLFGKCFGYGLKSGSASLTFILMILLGWIGVCWANYSSALVVDTAPVAFAVDSTLPEDPTMDPRKRTIGHLVFRVGSMSQFQATASDEEVDCRKQIEPLLYAADVFIPLLDLRQESQCRPRNGLWGFVKALYAGLGWLVTSLTILTVSGVMKRRIGS